MTGRAEAGRATSGWFVRLLVSMTRRVVWIALLASLAVGSAYAEGAGWGRPVTVISESTGLIGSYFVQSPSAARTAVVVSGASSRLVLVMRRADGSFGSRVDVPGERGVLGEDIAMNDRGAMVIGWPAYASNPPPGDENDLCWCGVRAVLRRADGRFGAVRDLAPPAAFQTAPGVAITPAGAAVAAWTDAGHALHVAEASAGGRFGASRTVATGVDDYFLDTVSGRPLLLWRAGQQVFELPSPFIASRPVGALGSGESLSNEDTIVASDRRGDELRVWAAYGNNGVDIRAAGRRTGESFGAPRVIAHAGPAGTACVVNATMSSTGQALAAWNCAYPDPGRRDGFGQAAYLASDGRPLALSHRQSVLAAGDRPAIALDRNGRAIAGWQMPDYRGYIAVTGAHRQFDRFRPIARVPQSGATPVDVAITPQRIGLATWVDEPGRRSERVRVASIRLPI